jgi:transposase
VKERAEARVVTVNRQQTAMRIVSVEGLVEGDHPVRAIWQFVGRLELSRFYDRIEAVEGGEGRPAWDPRMMISLWAYAYSRGVSSAREVSRLCDYDPAYQWLTGLQVVNYHSLSDFRVAHKAELEGLFTQMLGVLSSEGLITLERVMHDGTKIKACASGDSFRREERLRAHLEKAREQVKLMEEAGDEEVAPRLAQARQRAAREHQQRMEEALQELEQLQEAKKGEERNNVRVSMTDPGTRIMKQPNGGFAPSYNAQISTDAAHGVIVRVGLTQSGMDHGELEPALEEIQEVMGRLPEQAVVDGGYIGWETVLALDAMGVDLIGPAVERGPQQEEQLVRKGIAKEFHADAFTYDPQQDTFTCPEGKILKHRGTEKAPGRTSHIYEGRAADCLQCRMKGRCCPRNGSNGRTIRRAELHPVVKAWIDRMETEEAKAIYRSRSQIAEFPNAWIKAKYQLRQFRLRGKRKAGIEMLWACFTYNVQLWTRLCWRPAMTG